MEEDEKEDESCNNTEKVADSIAAATDDEGLSQIGVGMDEEGIVNFLSDAIGQEVGTEVLREFSQSDAFAELFDVVTSSLVPSGGSNSNRGNKYKSTKEAVISEDEKMDKEILHQSSTIHVQENQEKTILLNTQNTLNKDTNKKSSKGEIQSNKRKNSVESEDASQNFHETCLSIHRDIEFKNFKKKFGLNPCCVILFDLIHLGESFRDVRSFGGGGDSSLLLYIIKNPVVVLDSTVIQTHKLENLRRLNIAKKINSRKITDKTKTKEFKTKVPHVEESEIIPDPEELVIPVKSTEEIKSKLQLNNDEDDEDCDIDEQVENKHRLAAAEENSKHESQIKSISKSKRKEDRKETANEKLDVYRKSEKRHSSKEHDDIEASSTTDQELKNQEFGRRRDKDDVRARKFDKFEYERERKFSDRKKERHKKEIKAVFKPENIATGKSFANTFKIPKKHGHISYGLSQDVKVSTPLAKQEVPSENLKFERFRKGNEDKDNDWKLKSDWKPRNNNNNNNKRFNLRNSENVDRPLDHNNKNKISSELPLSSNWKNEPKKPTSENWDEEEEEVAKPLSECWDDEPPKPASDACSGFGDEPMKSDWENNDPKPNDPEEEGSLFGGRSSDSPLPPLSQVQVGDLAVEVTELLQEGVAVNASLSNENMNEFSENTDTTAQKCAWWFTKSEKEPPPSNLDGFMDELDQVLSPPGSSDNMSDTSFLGNVSNPGGIDDDDECQVHEISSTEYRYESNSGAARDPDIDEYCGRSLLQAKIRTGSGDTFQNIFDLRSGALYEKENFQAKCNLCNQLIVGKKDLAIHVRGDTHKENLTKIGIKKMGSSSDKEKTEDVAKSSDSDKRSKRESESKVDKKEKAEKHKRSRENRKDDKPSKKDSEEKISKLSRKDDLRAELKAVKKEEESRSYRVKREPLEENVEIGRTSTGLEIKVPASCNPVKRHSRSPIRLDSRRRTKSKSRSRHRSRSRSRERRRRKSRSPIRRIPRSPKEYNNISRRSRSRSRSPRRSSRIIPRSTSEEKVKEFLARTKRSKSPSNGHYSKRGRRSKSKSPPLTIKKDNREFHEKLALTADGKWTMDMENKWKLMEAQEAMFLEQFYDKRKSFISTPEEHPRYAEEWTLFWERRYQEVESAGKDPEKYDYVSEWKEYWAKRLKFLLQEEADLKIREIKRKYGMDFESLNKMRKLETKKPEVQETFQNPNFQPEPVPVPTHLENVHVLSNNVYTAAPPPIPIQDQNLNGTGMITGQPEMSLKRKPSVTVEEFKSTWDALTRPKCEEEEVTGSLTDGLKIAPRPNMTPLNQRMETEHKPNTKRRNSETKSEFTTSSDGYDFDGFDLVQVLRLMCKCEDQLSFLAPKVFEYFKMAEEMELAKSRGSHSLLDNEELVTVLFKSRDRFVSMIRSNVLSRDILKNLNLTVYALNAILDAPQCKKFHSKIQAAAVPEVQSLGPANEMNQSHPIQATTIINAATNQILPNNSIVSNSDVITRIFSNIPVEKKEAVASEISLFLVSVGRENMNHADLYEFLQKLLVPITQSKKVMTPPVNKNDLPRNDIVQNVVETNEPSETERKNTLFIDDEHSASARLQYVTSTRVVGSALPTLPPLDKRVAEPEVRIPASYLNSHSNRPNNRVSDENSDTRNNSDGRRSPFSRRDYSGNPIANNGGRI